MLKVGVFAVLTKDDCNRLIVALLMVGLIMGCSQTDQMPHEE